MQPSDNLNNFALQGFSPDTLERFWSKVHKTDTCWIWTAGADEQGYGRFGIGNRTELAHRVSWIIHYGTFSPELCVLHKCDNPPCVKPDDLFLGTRTDNSEDKMSKGRHDCGRRLYESDIIEILKFAGTQTQSELAKRFGVSNATISAVLTGRTWGHILPDIKREFAPKRPCGENNPMTFFTESDVRQIRSLYEAGENMSEIGRRYGVSKTVTRQIIRRMTWKHVS